MPRRDPLHLTADLVARVERKVPQDHLPPDPRRIPMTDEDFARDTDRIIEAIGDGPLWVFGYGSLLWNPGFDYQHRTPARLRGWHRAFCMELHRFRGSPEQPGLMLALDKGGSCLGEVFRVDPPGCAEAVGKLLRREVPYRRIASPWRWVSLDVEGQRVTALSFYTGMKGDPFHVKLPLSIQAHMLARAAGHGGSGAAYLHQTVTRLEELGIHDSYLWELQRLVAAEIRAMAERSDG